MATVGFAHGMRCAVMSAPWRGERATTTSSIFATALKGLSHGEIWSIRLNHTRRDNPEARSRRGNPSMRYTPRARPKKGAACRHARAIEHIHSPCQPNRHLRLLERPSECKPSDILNRGNGSSALNHGLLYWLPLWLTGQSFGGFGAKALGHPGQSLRRVSVAVLRWMLLRFYMNRTGSPCCGDDDATPIDHLGEGRVGRRGSSTVVGETQAMTNMRQPKLVTFRR